MASIAVLNNKSKKKNVSLVVVAEYSNDAAQQFRTESILWRLWQPLCGPCMTLEHSFQPTGISCMLVFAGGGKSENPEKNPRSRVENQHKLKPLMASGPGIEPGPHWWEARALTTAPTLLLISQCRTMDTNIVPSPPPPIYYIIIISLTCYNILRSFIANQCQVLFLGNHLGYTVS